MKRIIFILWAMVNVACFVVAMIAIACGGEFWPCIVCTIGAGNIMYAASVAPIFIIK